MSKKWTSIVIEAILMVVGIAFMRMSLTFDDGGKSLYAGAGYYPMIISGLLTLFSVTGILTDLFGKKKTDTSKIDISRIKNVGTVAIAIVIIMVFWRLLHHFYIGSFIAISVLLVSLNPEKNTKKSVIRDVFLSLVLCVVAFLSFEYALKIHV